MNRYHGWKFMLSAVAVWLALAGASPAQSCTDTCANKDVAPCLMAGNVCQVTINTDSSSSPPKVCVTLNNSNATYIEWLTAASGSTCLVGFSGESPVSPTAPECYAPYQIKVLAGCYTYSATYCPTPGGCLPPSKRDPEVIVQCNGPLPCIIVGKPKKNK